MRQPIELLQRESTSQRGARSEARGLFTASLPTQTCLSTKVHRDPRSKRACRGAKEARRDGNHQGARRTDAPTLWCTRHTPINDQILCSSHSLGKATFLPTPNSQECRQGRLLSTTPKGHLWPIYFFKQKPHHPIGILAIRSQKEKYL